MQRENQVEAGKQLDSVEAKRVELVLTITRMTRVDRTTTLLGISFRKMIPVKESTRIVTDKVIASDETVRVLSLRE